jgi:hypothetical protein
MTYPDGTAALRGVGFGLRPGELLGIAVFWMFGHVAHRVVGSWHEPVRPRR